MTCTLRQIVIVSGGLCIVKVDVSPREVLVELVQRFVVAALFGLLDTFEIQRYAFFIILKHRIPITYVLVQHGKVWFLLIGTFLLLSAVSLVVITWLCKSQSEW